MCQNWEGSERTWQILGWEKCFSVQMSITEGYNYRALDTLFSLSSFYMWTAVAKFSVVDQQLMIA